MENSNLLLSLPGTSDYQRLAEDPEGKLLFSFVSFDGQQSLKLRLRESEQEMRYYYKADHYQPVVVEQEQYHALVSKAIHDIRKNNWGKVVTSRAALYEMKSAAESVFHQVRKRYPKACVYLFSHPRSGSWLGATPETLLKKEGRQLETMSLAGTRVKGEESSFSAKERTEQQLVTDYIGAIFKQDPGLENVDITSPELSEAGNLVHYRSRITAGVRRGFDADALLARLHPTPAVAGMPRRESLQFLADNEAYDRSYYSGYFGLEARGDFHFFVNLRCMQIFENKVALYAGGGITADSDPQAEWEETEAKMRTLLNVIERAG